MTRWLQENGSAAWPILELWLSLPPSHVQFYEERQCCLTVSSQILPAILWPPKQSERWRLSAASLLQFIGTVHFFTVERRCTLQIVKKSMYVTRKIWIRWHLFPKCSPEKCDLRQIDYCNPKVNTTKEVISFKSHRWQVTSWEGIVSLVCVNGNFLSYSLPVVAWRQVHSAVLTDFIRRCCQLFKVQEIFNIEL